MGLKREILNKDNCVEEQVITSGTSVHVSHIARVKIGLLHKSMTTEKSDVNHESHDRAISQLMDDEIEKNNHD